MSGARRRRPFGLAPDLPFSLLQSERSWREDGSDGREW